MYTGARLQSINNQCSVMVTFHFLQMNNFLKYIYRCYSDDYDQLKNVEVLTRLSECGASECIWFVSGSVPKGVTVCLVAITVVAVTAV